MKYIADINIMPHAELLDPQGKTVLKNLPNVDIHGVEDVRIGKHITLMLEADSEEEAAAKVEKACKKLLANVIMETYTFEIEPATETVEE